MFEEQLSQTVISLIQNQGYTPFLQIPHFDGKIDFLGVNSSECIVIETKVSKWNKALKQAIRYGYGAERVFVALPEQTAQYVLDNFREKFESYGVGLISVTNDQAFILLESKYKSPSTIFKRLLLVQAQNRLLSSQKRVAEFIARFKDDRPLV